MEVLSFLVYSFIAVMVFSLFDYSGFNISLNKKWADYSLLNKYRVVQVTFQIRLSALLFHFSGWQPVIAFKLIWWT